MVLHLQRTHPLFDLIFENHHGEVPNLQTHVRDKTMESYRLFVAGPASVSSRRSNDLPMDAYFRLSKLWPDGKAGPRRVCRAFRMVSS
jgi:hypothetical protein